MPTALLPLLSVIVGAAGVGTSIYEGVQSSNQASDAQKAQKAALLQQQQQQAAQADLTKREAVLGASGQEQQQTGGSLTDSGTAALTDLLAGYPGYQSGSSSGTSTGTGVGTSGVSGASSPGGTGSSPDIASILAALRNGGSGGGGLGLSGPGAPGNLSGGNWQSQPATPQSQFELANPLV